MVQLPPWTRELREWQAFAYEKYADVDRQDFLMVATPGAGKTIAAARIAHAALVTGTAERLVVVVPTSHLRVQWANALATVGIRLDPMWQNGDTVLAVDYHGVVVTYQQVAAAPELHRALTQVSTFLIADEIHHAGDDRQWGGALKTAYDRAVRRLMLSGTPFRSDNKQIPWVRYKPDADGVSRSVADYSYSYGKALRDSRVRSVVFPTFQGQMVWMYGLSEQKATFADSLPEDESRRRLRTALDAKGQWIRDVLKAANQRLTEIRSNGHPSAGGLVFAMDQQHAREVAEVLRRITGRAPALALSDEPQASEDIASFARGMTPWLVAVKMVSEGVDIPRLRVGVYATNVISELFFRQAVGRIVRMVEGVEEQTAFMFIPADETLKRYAQHIEEERDHALADDIEQITGELGGSSRQTGIFSPISAEAQEDETILDRESVSPEEVERARALILDMSLAIPPEKIALLLRRYTAGAARPESAPITPPPPAEDEAPLHVQKKRMKEAVRRRVGILVGASCGTLDFQSVYTMLMKFDGMDAKTATLEQMIERVKWLDEQIEEYRRG
jgi:superfamily II DNA or RNA helicase